jgi:hypothetical protein
MKTKLLLIGFVGLCLPIMAGEPQPNTVNTTPNDLRWDNSPAHWDRVLSERRTIPELQIGKSDFVVRGPLIEGFRYRRSSDLSLGQKLLRLPVVNMFVPMRMAQPPRGTGHYFAWRGETDRPWGTVAAGAPVGAALNGAYNEPTGSLISLSLSGH